ncbi:MAG: VCBS repeat-containing protein, partial [Planctomycetes bacterium]|nr:VCBS repeat-containing protein [Planctomycetota bacterium]
HVDPCDLDGDGAIDLVVADLGSFFPDDHDRGRIVWLRRRKPSDTYEEVVIASALGRVADVRLADFDDDGDLDMIVAEFGAERRGNILLLRNVSAADGPPRFEAEEVDPRPGAIHVPLHDLDGDGRQDFVALISQEYECVEAFINQGNAQFHMQTLWAGPDPTFGSSGIELVDLDEDGDVDVLYTNGDAFDDNYAKLSHGVRWLENLGDLEFCHHRLTDLPGAHRALAGDVDLDGDLDVIATAFLPPQVMPPSLADVPLASIVCLEQTSPGTFVRHTLETDRPHHATFELADFDGDGDLDFAAGFHTATATNQLPYGLSVWWNQGRPTDE